MRELFTTQLVFLAFITGLLSPEMALAKDNHKTITLSSEEREHVLAEMRVFLESVQAIIAASSKDDMATVVKAAKKSGFAGQGGAPATLPPKLPLEFKKLGMGTHKAFDQLALDAEAMEDKDQVVEQLGQLMENCVACHSMFRFDLQEDAKQKE